VRFSTTLISSKNICGIYSNCIRKCFSGQFKADMIVQSVGLASFSTSAPQFIMSVPQAAASGLQGVLQSSSSVVAGITQNGAAFRAAGTAIAEMGVAGLIGIGCVHRDLLNAPTVAALSKTCFNILLPMFLSTSIMNTISSYGLPLSSLCVPLLAMIQSFTLYLVARHILLPLFNIDYETDVGRSTSVCCAWGNSGVIPLIFAESLFRPPYQPSDLLAKCIGQVSLYLVGWSPFFWSFGRSVLIRSEEDNAAPANKSKKNIKVDVMKLFPPPVVGVMGGLALMLSPLGNLFLHSPAVAATSSRMPPLSILFNTVQNFGRAANPLALLVLTASLAMGIGVGNNSNKGAVDLSKDDGPQVSTLKRWACVSVSRFVLSPMLMLALLKTFAKAKLIPSKKVNPAMWFVLILQSCMPSAQNTVLMLQVEGKGGEASRLAKFLFLVYSTSMIPVVLVVSSALQALELI
jgi:predicted permease